MLLANRLAESIGPPQRSADCTNVKCMTPSYTYAGLIEPYQYSGPVTLYAELDGSSCVSQYLEESGATQLAQFLKHVERNMSDAWAANAIPVRWTVEPAGERAPTCDYLSGQSREDEENFLSFYTWPKDTEGRRINWFSLSVEMETTLPSFVEALGWAPSPLQATCPIRSIIARS